MTWEIDRLVAEQQVEPLGHPDADDGVDRDPRRDEEQDPALAKELYVLAQAVLCVWWRGGVLILHAVGEEEQREYVDHTVHRKGCRSEDRPEWAGQRGSRDEESAECCHFEEGDNTATEFCVMARLRRHVRKDGRNARRR